MQGPGAYLRVGEGETGPPLAAAQRNTRELSRDEEAYFSEAAGVGPLLLQNCRLSQVCKV